jgi:hypothetical protein
MIKKIKSFFLDQPASIIKELNYLKNKKIFNLEKDITYNFGEKNKNKIFYVINRSPGAGFFSNLTFVLNHMEYAKKKKFIPIIDMQNFPTIYNENKKIFNSLNAWDYYFKKINKYKLSEVYKSYKVIFSTNYLKDDMYGDISDNKNFIRFKKKIKIRNSYYNEAKSFIKKRIKKDKKIIGVHLRGTTYKIAKNHPYPIPKKMMLNILNQVVKKEKVDKIFLCTEEKEYQSYFKKKLGNKLITFNSFRTEKVDAFNFYPRRKHRFNLGKEILIESIILSNCDILIYVNSNVIEGSLFFSKKKIKKYEIFLGNNSNNKFIAKRLWYIKNLFPSFLGGFNNKIRLEELNFK